MNKNMKKSLSILLSAALLVSSADFSVFAANVSRKNSMEKVWKEIADDGEYKDYVRTFEDTNGQKVLAVYPFPMKDDLTEEAEDEAVSSETETFAAEDELEAEEADETLAIEEVTSDTDSTEGETDTSVSDETVAPSESSAEEEPMETESEVLLPSGSSETYDQSPEYLQKLFPYSGTWDETAPQDGILKVQVSGENPNEEGMLFCTGYVGEENIYSTFTLPAFLEEITPDPENCQVSLLLYPEPGCSEVTELYILQEESILGSISFDEGYKFSEMALPVTIPLGNVSEIVGETLILRADFAEEGEASACFLSSGEEGMYPVLLVTEPETYVSEEDLEPEEEGVLAGEGSEEESYIIAEDITLRDAYTKHFLTEDKGMAAAVYGMKVHFKEDDAWKEIDNRLSLQKEGDREVYKNLASDTDIIFARYADEGALVTMGSDAK